MLLEYIKDLYAYTYWADERILETAERVSEEQRFAPQPGGYGSIHTTLVHMISAQRMWLSRWQGTSTSKLDPQDFPTLASIRARWQQTQQNLRVFINALSEADLARHLTYTNSAGNIYSPPIWQLIVHLVNHGTQHRSELALMLSALGYSPGDLDLAIYLLDVRLKRP